MSNLKTKVEYNEERDRGYVLTVTYKGKVIRQEFDDTEPEDNLFVRDYRWIEDAIKEAFELGRKDMAEELDHRPDE